MKAVDIIIKHIEENGLSQKQAAEMAGMSRQNFWDKLNKGNPRFNSMERIMEAFGYEIRIREADGLGPDFDEQRFFQTVRKENPMYDTLEAIVNAMDYILVVEKKSDVEVKTE